jgi:hypothetical protein
MLQRSRTPMWALPPNLTIRLLLRLFHKKSTCFLSKPEAYPVSLRILCVMLRWDESPLSACPGFWIRFRRDIIAATSSGHPGIHVQTDTTQLRPRSSMPVQTLLFKYKKKQLMVLVVRNFVWEVSCSIWTLMELWQMVSVTIVNSWSRKRCV